MGYRTENLSLWMFHIQCPLVLLIKVDCREYSAVGSKEGNVLGSGLSGNGTEDKFE